VIRAASLVTRGLAVSAAAFLVLACAGSAEPPRHPADAAPAVPAVPAATPAPAPVPPPFTTLVQRAIPGQSGGEIRKVARDGTAWLALWAEMREGASADLLPVEAPAIDFDREMALVVAMPTQSCFSEVGVQSVATENGELVVHLREAPPAANCRCFVAARPLHAIRLPRHDGAVRFVVERGETPCGKPAP
jgi:hypothetical protein